MEHIDWKQEFAKRILSNIRDIRMKKGYGQEYMANKLNVSQAAYSYWEKGARELSYNTLLSIAEVLGYSGNDVINIITYPEIYVRQQSNTQEKVSVTFEVDPQKRDYLLRLVMGEKMKNE